MQVLCLLIGRNGKAEHVANNIFATIKRFLNYSVKTFIRRRRTFKDKIESIKSRRISDQQAACRIPNSVTRMDQNEPEARDIFQFDREGVTKSPLEILVKATNRPAHEII